MFGSQQKNNLKVWFCAGITCVLMGPKLISKHIVQNQDFNKLKNNARQALAIIQKVRAI